MWGRLCEQVKNEGASHGFKMLGILKGETMKKLILLSCALSAFSAHANEVSCSYVSGPNEYDQVAVVEFVRTKALKSVALYPEEDAHYEAITFVDYCEKTESKKNTYSCENPLHDLKIDFSFEGKVLTKFEDDGSVDAVFVCE